MTTVQNEYWKRKETERANRAMEEIKRQELSESFRHNSVTERETNRSNLANEGIKSLEANAKLMSSRAQATKNYAEAALTGTKGEQQKLYLARDKRTYTPFNNWMAGVVEPTRTLGGAIGDVVQIGSSIVKALR